MRIAIFAVLLIPAALTAQQTWVVDANNGTGTHFTDFPAAFAAVAHGDRVLVRPGSYNPGRLDKAVRLVAEAGAVVTLNRTDFLITGIPAGRVCAVQGLQFQSRFLATASVCVHDNSGPVVFANVRVELQSGHIGIHVARTKAVTLTDVVVRPQLTVEESELSATRSYFGPYPTGPVTVGVSGYKARLDLTHCIAAGFNGFGHAPGTPAVQVASTSLVIRGDSSSVYIGGTYGGNSWSPSITGNNDSTLVTDPAVVLSPAPQKMLSITTQRLAALCAYGGRLGGTLDIDLFSPAAHVYALAVALPAAPFDLPFGRQWLDLPSEIILLFGVQGASEFTRHTYPVPGAASLRGLALGFQALSGTGAVLELTNPVIPALF